MAEDTEEAPIRLAIGRAIKQARLADGLSMRQFAERCGVSQPFISAVERGLSSPSVFTLYRMASVLGIDAAALLPANPGGEIVVVRSDDGARDHERSGDGVEARALFAQRGRPVEVHEFTLHPGRVLVDVRTGPAGEVVVHVLGGIVRVELDGTEPHELGVGDCLVHPVGVSHRWEAVGDGPAKVFVVVAGCV